MPCTRIQDCGAFLDFWDSCLHPVASNRKHDADKTDVIYIIYSDYHANHDFVRINFI